MDVGADSVLPSGVVAFLFSDIEGSTNLLHRLGPAYGGHLQQYRDLLTHAFECRGGVVLGSEGDSLFVGFERVTSALCAAVDGQLALQRHAWPRDTPVRARMGVHVGEVERLGAGYVGMAIHVAARVCSAAHGGQILTTEAALSMASDVGAIELGEHRLKDVGAMRLLQVVHAELPSEFPPPRVVGGQPNNLPATRDDFIGRTAELSAARAALEQSRLVTLTGPGGAGKTRLAIELAHAVLTDFRDGVWFVALASAMDEDRIIPQIASAIHLSDRTDESLAATLEGWLRDRHALLVLDNCEHLVEGVSAVVDRLLATCPQLRLLATSREILGVRAERPMRVPPLGTQEDDQGPGGSDAVALLLARAEAMVPGFDRRSADARLALQICRRLDGLPLAIELAAARLRVLSLEQLATRLDDRFRLLTGGKRTDLPRHQTLQAVVTWSYDLLREAERHVFCRLSVFADDFSLEGAEAVVSGPPVMENDVLDVLTRLVEKSLVVTTTTAGAYRYRLLETLRQYGTERLLDAGELAQWRSRLLAWAMTLVADVERSLRTPRQDAAIARAAPEQANLRSAVAWARELGDTESALRIVAAVPIGLISERRQLICDVLDEAAASGEIEAGLAGRAWSALANIALEQSDWAFGIDAAQRAAVSYRRAGLFVHQAWAELLEMWLQWGAGNHESVDEAAGRITQTFRDLNDDFGLGYTLWVASLRAADLDEAAAMAAEADRLLRRSGSRVGVAHNVEGRAIIAFDRRELAAAAGFAAEAVKLFSGSVNYGCTAHALEVAAVVLASDDDHDRRVPAELLGAAEMFREISGQGHRPWEIRARHGGADYLDLHSTADLKAAGRQHTLASAAATAIDALGRTGAA